MTSKDEDELVEEAWEPSEFPAAEDEERICANFEGIGTSAAWRIKDYQGKGALSDTDLATLAKGFGLPQSILERFSIEIGLCLDSNSLVNLNAVDRDVAIARANITLEKAAGLASRVEQDLTNMRRFLSSLSTDFVSNAEQQGVLASAQQRTEAVQKAAVGLHDTIDRAIKLPGSAADMSPRDKRHIVDGRRRVLVETCCYAWKDAGREVTITTSPERVTDNRRGPLIEFIQAVAMMVSDPPARLSGETLRKDIGRWEPEDPLPDEVLIGFE